METETKQLIKGGEFIIKDTRPEDILVQHYTHLAADK